MTTFMVKATGGVVGFYEIVDMSTGQTVGTYPSLLQAKGAADFLAKKGPPGSTVEVLQAPVKEFVAQPHKIVVQPGKHGWDVVDTYSGKLLGLDFKTVEQATSLAEFNASKAPPGSSVEVKPSPVITPIVAKAKGPPPGAHTIIVKPGKTGWDVVNLTTGETFGQGYKTIALAQEEASWYAGISPKGSTVGVLPEAAVTPTGPPSTFVVQPNHATGGWMVVDKASGVTIVDAATELEAYQEANLMAASAPLGSKVEGQLEAYAQQVKKAITAKPKPKPSAMSTMAEFKAGLQTRESVQQALMVKQWMKVEARLKDDIAAIAKKAFDGKMTASQVANTERYRALLGETRAEINKYQNWAEGVISTGQQEMGALGIDHAVKTIEAAQADAGLRVSFDRLSVDAVQGMVGICADGAPLFDVLAQRAILPDAVEGLRTALLQGTALGWNPRQTAEAMADGLTAGLQKALVIARDSQLRVYRAASDAEYEASGVVQDKMRVAAKDGRACLACLAADGEIVPLSSPGYDHVQGRCLFVPRVIGQSVEDLRGGTPTGREWLESQPADKQAEIMGKSYFDAYKSGKIDFSQLVTTTEHDIWGKSLSTPSLTSLGIRKEPVLVTKETAAREFMAANATRLVGTKSEINDTIMKECGMGVAGATIQAEEATGGAGIFGETPIMRTIRGSDGRIQTIISSEEYASYDPNLSSTTHVVVRNDRFTSLAERDRVIAAIRAEAMQFSNNDLKFVVQYMDGDKLGKLVETTVSRDDCVKARLRATPELGTLTVPPLEKLSNYGTLLGSERNSTAGQLKAKVMMDIGARLNGDPDLEPLIFEFSGRYGGNDVEKVTAFLVEQWAMTSGDANGLSISVQHAVTQEFGLRPYSAMNPEASLAANEEVDSNQRPGLRAFVRAQYTQTQEYLKSQKIEFVDVVRGIGMPDGVLPRGGSIQEMALQPISSWSTTLRTAIEFAEGSAEDAGGTAAVLHARVPASRVFSIARTGVGCLDEAEVVVLGSNEVEEIKVFSTPLSYTQGDWNTPAIPTKKAMGWGT